MPVGRPAHWKQEMMHGWLCVSWVGHTLARRILESWVGDPTPAEKPRAWLV